MQEQLNIFRELELTRPQSDFIEHAMMQLVPMPNGLSGKPRPYLAQCASAVSSPGLFFSLDLWSGVSSGFLCYAFPSLFYFLSDSFLYILFSDLGVFLISGAKVKQLGMGLTSTYVIQTVKCFPRRYFIKKVIAPMLRCETPSSATQSRRGGCSTSRC